MLTTKQARNHERQKPGRENRKKCRVLLAPPLSPRSSTGLDMGRISSSFRKMGVKDTVVQFLRKVVLGTSIKEVGLFHLPTRLKWMALFQAWQLTYRSPRSKQQRKWASQQERFHCQPEEF